MKISTTISTFALAGLALGLPAETSPKATHKLFARATCSDRGPGGFGCPVADARACADYLIQKDTTECKITTARYTLNCDIGNCYVSGRALPAGSTYASSYCRDVGYGVRGIIDSCTTDNGYVAGYSAAGGNGNYGVTLGNSVPS